MGYLFVSYSRWDRKENPVIDRLLNDLRTAGVNLWLVPDDVPPGADWKQAKPEGLKGADGVLFLFGRPLSKTKLIADELQTAKESGLPIYVVVINERGMRELPEHADLFKGMTILSVRNDYDASLRKLIDTLPASDKREVIRAVNEVAIKPQSRGYIFISYTEEDTPFVERLRSFLAEKGYGYWDYQDSDRNYHTQLFLELEDVIENASATLSVLSPDWKKSPWTAKEYLFSEQVGTPVFLLMARMMEPTLVIAGVPYIDFTTNEAKGFERLDRELRRKGLI